MKIIIATAALITSLLSAPLGAADAAPPVALTIEQQFDKADIESALQHYRKLRDAAFDISLRLDTEELQEEFRKELQDRRNRILALAAELRETTIKKDRSTANTK